MRSLLFVPGTAPDKMQKALTSGADALILDLEDSVALADKAAARKTVADFLKSKPASPAQLIVRINPLSDENDLAAQDLEAVMPYAPGMIMLPKAEGGAHVQWLGAKLGVHEAKNNLGGGGTGIIAIAPETPSAVFTMGSFAGASERLKALTWGGGEDLSAYARAKTNRNEDGTLTEPYRMVRNLCIFAAAAAGVSAIDGVFTNFRDLEGAKQEAQQAARDGFSGKLAIHPAQVPVFNAAFTPDAAEIEQAQAIVEAFSTAGAEAGVVNFNGRMLDRPHLARAKAVIERAAVGNK